MAQQHFKVSVIIVTFNRPKLLFKAINSVLSQTFQDFEIIVVDNGIKLPANQIVKGFNDGRIKYIQNNKNTGCSGGKNIGIKNATGDFIAFLDDDDIWVPAKLEIQMSKLENSPNDVGFCFTAVVGVYDDYETKSVVPEGINNYYERALRRFNGFLSSGLMIKKAVFYDIGLLDEKLPTHTDIDLIIRITKKYKGIGINNSLVKMSMQSNHQQMGSNLKNKIIGRKMILSKYANEYKTRPDSYSVVGFRLAIYYRENSQYNEARKMFKKICKAKFNLRYFLHYLSMLFNGKIYRFFKNSNE